MRKLYGDLVKDELRVELDRLYRATRFKKNHRRAYRLALIERFGVCHWCGIKVRDFTGPFTRGEQVPEDMATVDHVVSRFLRERGELSVQVLACHPCNTKRAQEEEKLYGNKRESKGMDLLSSM